MKLLYECGTIRELNHLLTGSPKTTKKVYAAIAYNQDSTLIDICIKHKIQMEWWGLLNYGLSTKIDIVKKALKSDYVKFYPFAENFHPKVIYFEGYGLYVGSANMTKTALRSNVEAGVFIPEDELLDKQKAETFEFFKYLRDKSIVATDSDISRIEEYFAQIKDEKRKMQESEDRIKKTFKDKFPNLFLLPCGVTDWKGGDGINKEEKQKNEFLQEWKETQNYIQKISTLLAECKQPEWILPNAHLSIIVDQFLHAYYELHILEKNKDDLDDEENKGKIERLYQKHKTNPKNALMEGIEWWESLSTPPNSEDISINIWGIKNSKLFNIYKTRNLSKEEFFQVFWQNNAAKNHARQIRNEFFTLPENYKTTREERTHIYTNWLYDQKSSQGLSVHETLKYLLFSNEKALEERIFDVLYDDKYKIERLGKSIIGELVGWALPEKTFLRNNRVNKALRCLGYNVRLF